MQQGALQEEEEEESLFKANAVNEEDPSFFLGGCQEKTGGAMPALGCAVKNGHALHGASAPHFVCHMR